MLSNCVCKLRYSAGDVEKVGEYLHSVCHRKTCFNRYNLGILRFSINYNLCILNASPSECKRMSDLVGEPEFQVIAHLFAKVVLVLVKELKGNQGVNHLSLA